HRLRRGEHCGGVPILREQPRLPGAVHAVRRREQAGGGVLRHGAVPRGAPRRGGACRGVLRGGAVGRPAVHSAALSSVPASSSRARTALASTTAPGVSPCRHRERTGSSTHVPSAARTPPAVTI